MMLSMLEEPSPPPELLLGKILPLRLENSSKATGSIQWKQRLERTQIAYSSCPAWALAGSGSWSEFSSLASPTHRLGCIQQYHKPKTESFHLAPLKPLHGVASQPSSSCVRLHGRICSPSKLWDLLSFGRLSVREGAEVNYGIERCRGIHPLARAPNCYCSHRPPSRLAARTSNDRFLAAHIGLIDHSNGSTELIRGPR